MGIWASEMFPSSEICCADVLRQIIVKYSQYSPNYDVDDAAAVTSEFPVSGMNKISLFYSILLSTHHQEQLRSSKHFLKRDTTEKVFISGTFQFHQYF